jgi:hypothetical protein
MNESDRWQENEAVDTEFLVQQRRVTRLLPPATKQRASVAVEGLERRMRSSDPPSDLRKAALRAAKAQFEKLSRSDGEVLAFYVLAESAKHLDDEIARITTCIKVIRQVAKKFHEIIYDLSGCDTVTIRGLRSLLDDLKGKLDGMNEMSEMTSLRLQMTMDRRSKFISSLSQMMKKISTTQDILIQNIK